MDRLAAHRAFYADLITASLGPARERIKRAFAEIPREQFLGKGPWRVLTGAGYVFTPNDDPALIYQDILVALTDDGPINNGQPSLHALCLDALDVHPGETVVHVGAGAGYYTAVLSRLVGSYGCVLAYEIDRQLAGRATQSLADRHNVVVHHRSGSAGALPSCDVLYVNAGATAPLDLWIDALLPKGRLLFPLTPAHGFGGMLLVTKSSKGCCASHFLCRALFIPCIGARDDETAKRLTAAFKNRDIDAVKSLRRGTLPDETCWFSGHGWWLSTAEA